MNVRLLLLFALANAAPSLAPPAQSPGTRAAAASDSAARREVIAVLTGYHAALADRRPDRVLDYLGSTYFMGNDWSAPQAERVQAHLFLSGERLAQWPANYLSQVAPHRNTFEVTSVSTRANAAVVITRDSGSNAFRSWREEETAWYLGRVDDTWRIVGMVIRDFQPPK